MRDQTALFLPDPVQIVPAEHQSNPLGAEYEMILREGKKFVLNIGAGATATRYANCIEFEHKIFRNTDVVGDAHCLPFRNEIFDCVFAFNVFEHLENPRCPNFTVPFMLAFLLSAVLESVGASCGQEAREAVGQTRLRDWADLWSDRSKVPAVFQELQNLPNEFQSRISAGFELVARKP